MSATDNVTGYDTEDRLYATRYLQGGRRVYAIDLSPSQIVSYVPEPNPDRVTEGNRRIRPKHAADFAGYIREQENWVSPALLLRSPDIFSFETKEEIAGTEFGVLSMPRLARGDLHVLDGQHRILGMHLALRDIAADLSHQRAQLAIAKKNEQEPAVIKQFEGRIAELDEQRRRLGSERVAISIMIEDDPAAYKQMFFDIADNALGITSSVRARFDSRKVVNRSLEDVLKHALLRDRVDPEQDRIAPSSKYLMGAKHAADITRTIAVGVSGRIGRRLEDELKEDALVERTNEFLNGLLDAFPDLAAVADGELSPDQLRQQSLLGSTTFLRVLAGVWYELIHEQKYDPEDVVEFFGRLAPHMAAPIDPDSIWLHASDEVFIEGARAPKARRQDLKGLTEDIVGWAEKRPSWLTESSASA